MTFLKQSPSQPLHFLAALKNQDALNAEESMAITRCLAMARRFGARVDVFMPCENSADLHSHAGTNDPNGEPIDTAHRQNLTVAHGELTAFVNRHNTTDLNVNCITSWAQPDEQRLQQKIDSLLPDLVFLDSEEPSFGWGLTETDEWRLLRDSQVPVWFVKANDPLPQFPTLLAAVGSGNAQSRFNEIDVDVLRLTQELADLTQGETHAVHSVPEPKLGPLMVAASLTERPLPIAAGHKKLVNASRTALKQLAGQMPSPPDELHLCQGLAKNAVPEVAQEVDADILVLGAKPLGYWSRLVKSVTAEPVLSNVDCDVIYVPANSGPSPTAPAAQVTPPRDAEGAFEAKQPRPFPLPGDIVEAKHLTSVQKRRILRSRAGSSKQNQATTPRVQVA